MRRIAIRISVLAGIALAQTTTAAVVGFESVILAPESQWDGSDLSGTAGPPGTYGEIPYLQEKQIEGVGFRNTYTDWGGSGSWSGFAVSNHTDNTTPGFLNQYSAFPGSGAGGSSNYAVGYYSTFETTTNVTYVTFPGLADLNGLGAYITNTTWTALDMLNGGGGFGSKKYGGATGDDPDWLLLRIEGFDGAVSTGFIDFYLADFRFADNAFDYVIDDWTWVDLSPLGSVDRLLFTMDSSNKDAFGINTPTYFAMDDFLTVPEPSSLIHLIAGLGLVSRRRR